MNKNATLAKPHDALFRSMMQDPQVARDFFEATLPEEQLDLYKWFGPMAFLMKEIRALTPHS